MLQLLVCVQVVIPEAEDYIITVVFQDVPVSHLSTNTFQLILFCLTVISYSTQYIWQSSYIFLNHRWMMYNVRLCTAGVNGSEVFC